MTQLGRVAKCAKKKQIGQLRKELADLSFCCRNKLIRTSFRKCEALIASVIIMIVG